uniref:Peptidase S72 domain-containing protein n=1 Tax=Steinernema glaseri TaxID=37863 RepID=A0A1I7YHY9_9BILA
MVVQHVARSLKSPGDAAADLQTPMTGAVPRKTLLLLIALYAFAALGFASPLKVKLPEAKAVLVGQIFVVHLGASNLSVHVTEGNTLPKWMRYENETLYGIPQVEDIGNYLVTVSGNGFSNTINVTATDDFVNPCGESPTVWMEYYANDNLDVLSLTEQRAEMSQLADTYEVLNIEDIRIYPYAYKITVTETEKLSENLEKQPGDQDMTAVLMWRISCSELDEEAMTTISAAVDNDAPFAVRQGHVTTKQERKPWNAGQHVAEAVTEVPQVRTTRKVDNPPVRMNSLPSFKCKRGIICVLNIPPKTFLDPEDGDETKLRLSVHATITSQNFLSMVEGSPKMQGVPMEKGTFGFRLEARDSSNQVTSGAFQVSVEDAPPSNHRFIMTLEPSLTQLTSDPTTLVKFVNRLSTVLYDRSHPEHVQIHSLQADGTKSLLTWSNSSISHKFCHRQAINSIKKEMTSGSKNKAKMEFVRSMGVQFHVRSVDLELYGNCDRPTASTTPFTEVGDSNTSVVPKKEAEAQPAGDNMFLTVTLVLLLIVVGLIAAIVCFLSFRRKAEKKKQSADYVSKGMPVVFPEEVPQEEENASVASPMLVKEERPPLVVSHHDNPLYKPPPPLAAGASPRPKTAASNQRLPPPYVPP